MTDVKVTTQDGFIVEVSLCGHAGYGEEGEDIVCAGVSTLVNTTLLGLLQVACVNVKYDVNDAEAKVGFVLPKDLTVAQAHDAQVILRTMLGGLQSLYSEYSDFINLEVI